MKRVQSKVLQNCVCSKIDTDGRLLSFAFFLVSLGFSIFCSVLGKIYLIIRKVKLGGAHHTQEDWREWEGGKEEGNNREGERERRREGEGEKENE